MSVVAFVPSTRSLAPKAPTFNSGGRALERRMVRPERPYAAFSAGDLKMELPFAPVETTMGGYASDWTTTDRVGRAPLVRFKGPKGRTLSFDVDLARTDGSPCEDMIKALQKLGASGDPITLSNASQLEAGPWRMTGCTINVIARNWLNMVTHATASLEFLAASDITVGASPLPAATGPLTEGVKKTPTVPPASTARTYTVKSGDSLWTIAKAFYGDPEKWRKIATANPTVRNANLIYPGQRLTIPA